MWLHTSKKLRNQKINWKRFWNVFCKKSIDTPLKSAKTSSFASFSNTRFRLIITPISTRVACGIRLDFEVAIKIVVDRYIKSEKRQNSTGY